MLEVLKSTRKGSRCPRLQRLCRTSLPHVYCLNIQLPHIDQTSHVFTSQSKGRAVCQILPPHCGMCQFVLCVPISPTMVSRYYRSRIIFRFVTTWVSCRLISWPFFSGPRCIIPLSDMTWPVPAAP